MTKVYNYLSVNQPIGQFYICSIPAVELLTMVETRTRGKDEYGVQRSLSSTRVNEVCNYCSDPDAVFPTPIVVSVNDTSNVQLDEGNNRIIIYDEGIIGDVIDGQHRLWGIMESSNRMDFMLPVVFMFGLTIEEKAYVFSTINSNQRKVDPSLIFDLFDVAQKRSPFKTVHEAARVMNYKKESPFYNRLKMLGKREKSQENATLSQGTFAKSLLKLISMKPDQDVIMLKRGEQLFPDERCPLRPFFIQDRDDVIIKILLNCFGALRIVFDKEWENPTENILWKTTGFCGVMYSLRSILRKGIRENQLTQTFFLGCFRKLKSELEKKEMTLTSKSFPGGGEQNQKRLAKMIVECAVIDDVKAYNEGLNKTKSLQEFIDWIGDVDKYELFDIAYALDKGNVAYDTIKVTQMPSGIELLYPNADVFVVIPESDRKSCLKYLEDKYMYGMDADSWLGYRLNIEKND